MDTSIVRSMDTLDKVLSGTEVGVNPSTTGSGRAPSINVAKLVLGGGAPSSLNR